MSDNHESIADIVAGMRYGTIPKHRTDHELLALFADRIEAAEKRERAFHAMTEAANARLREHLAIALKGGVGNAAKLREALVLALSLLDLKEGVPYKTISQKDIDFMKAALAAPARNCDIGTADEQNYLHGLWCCAHDVNGDMEADCANNACSQCILKWAQMPFGVSYKEGGAK